jgi:hypothetical protein
MVALTQLYNMARAGFGSTEAYQRVQGNNPDGTPNPAYPVLIDLDNLIDYMLIIIYGGNKDAPISNFLSNTNPNNFYSLRNRLLSARMGFVSFAHDAEHTLLVEDLNINRVGPFPSGDTGVSKSNPQWIFQKFWDNAEFKVRLADRIQKHFFNNGLLTPAANTARLNRRKAELDRAVVAESARWGDSKRATPLNRDDHWIPAVNDVLTRYFPQRTQIVTNQLRAAGLFPTVVAPSFSQHGGNVSAGFRVSVTAPAGDIYYTLDGTDPRLTGGAIAPGATRYTGAITLNDHTTLKARAFSGGTWSALNEAPFTIIRTFNELMITELMYNPPRFGTVDGDELEFVELKNVGSQELQLGGIRFTNGIDYVFRQGARLAPGEFYVLVRNPEQFALKYPGVRIDGIYPNRLANSGETIALVHAAGALITRFTFSDRAPWPTSPDGSGFSLVPRALDPTLDFNLAANWRASTQIGGSPGRDDLPANIPPVVVNEVLTHTDLPALDAVELHNPTAAPADVSGWFLSDNSSNPTKFKIPANTVIPPGGYVVFDESHFNAQPGVAPSFSFSSHGEEVLLSAASADGNLLGYSDGFRFRAAENGVSFGRYTNSAGQVLFPAQLSTTLGRANSGPRVGPVVINEIRYAPGPAQDEFVELKNITGTSVSLFNSRHPTNTWKIDGIDFTFPPNTQIPAFGRVVVAKVAPELFRSRNNLPESIPVFGPFSGGLQDNGELIELVRPDNPDFETNGAIVTTVVPYIVVDAVRYSDQLPWPTNVAGTSGSIERKVSEAFGNDPSNWRASPGAASPGIENDGNRLPVVRAGANIELVAAAFPVLREITGEATDDGKVNATLSYQWSQVSGPGVVQIQNANQRNATFGFPGTGVFVLRFSANDGEFTVSDTLSVTITRPLQALTLLPRGSVWRFLDDGTDQGTAWRAISFNDTAWKSGPAKLGYGDPATTVVGFGPNSASKYITTYFRRSFSVTGARNIVSLTGRLLRDDGAVVYLNGSEIYRANMPPGTVNYLTRASSAVGGADETTYFDFSIDPAALREGNNVFAIEIHQSAPDSSDLGFDLELVGMINAANQAPTANAGPDLTSQSLTVTLNGSATDDGLPNPPGVFTATWNFLSGPGSVSFANANSLNTTATFSQGGTYQLRLSVSDSQLTATDDLQVTVTAADPYTEWKQQNFTAAELANPQISGDDADPDTDGFTNRQEFIAGTNPKDPRSYLHVADVSLEEDNFVVTFEAIGDKSYTIQGRTDAASGEWQRVVDLSPQGENSVIDVLDRMKAPGRRVYRIVTPQQPLVE